MMLSFDVEQNFNSSAIGRRRESVEDEIQAVIGIRQNVNDVDQELILAHILGARQKGQEKEERRDESEKENIERDERIGDVLLAVRVFGLYGPATVMMTTTGHVRNTAVCQIVIDRHATQSFLIVVALEHDFDDEERAHDHDEERNDRVAHQIDPFEIRLEEFIVVAS